MTSTRGEMAKAHINADRLWSSLMRLADVGSYTDERPPWPSSRWTADPLPGDQDSRRQWNVP
jgi:hypothetical protein